MAILETKNLSYVYGVGTPFQKTAVDNVSISVEKGEFVGIMGAYGSGKTTLLNCISTVDKVTAGHIYVEDKDITSIKGRKLNQFRREELGFIFQDFNLLDTLTAYENIALPLSIQNIRVEEINSRVMEIAGKLDITEVMNKHRLTSAFITTYKNIFKWDRDFIPINISSNIKVNITISVQSYHNLVLTFLFCLI